MQKIENKKAEVNTNLAAMKAREEDLDRREKEIKVNNSLFYNYKGLYRKHIAFN